MSRFIHQLKFETKHKIKHYNLSFDINTKSQEGISIKKDKNIILQLNKYLGNEHTLNLSPSGINTYLSCKLKFYFRYIAGLKEQENLLEEIDPPTFGNILHNTMEDLYSPFLGKTISIEDIKSITQESVEKAITHSLKKEFNITDEKTLSLNGKNIIIKNIIKKYILQILKIDSKYAPFEILGLEKELNTKINITLNKAPTQVNIFGKIDRIDKIDNNIRIIDYKTGQAKLILNGEIGKLFSDESKDRNNAIFQTFLYSKLFSDNYKPAESIIPGIYSMRNSHNKNFDYRLRLNKTILTDYNTVDIDFSNHLSNLLSQIFDPEIEFTQTKDIKTCEYCAYRSICNR